MGWEVAIELPYNQQGIEIFEDDEGFIIAALATQNFFGISDPDAGVYLIKTDALGEVLWTKSLKFPDSTFIQSVQRVEGGEFIVAGYQLTESINANAI